LLAAGSWLLVAASWLLLAGCWLLALVASQGPEGNLDSHFCIVFVDFGVSFVVFGDSSLPRHLPEEIFVAEVGCLSIFCGFRYPLGKLHVVKPS